MRDFASERRRMVQRYRAQGYIKTERMAEAMLKVPRELFVDPEYLEYAYIEQPLPIPGDGRQTISAPYMYPIFYEALGLDEGDKVLEVGAGSGYGAALAREMVGSKGLVVTIEINPITYRFAVDNLRRAGYEDVVVILGDGSLGYPEMAPYDAICVTAACPDIPKPLIEQLNSPGRLIAPVGHTCDIFGQDLILLEKDERGRTSSRALMKVAYVPLIGRYGWTKR
jgi:protein-L-isoaspartate(D-aspartate) O-methyltransferase